MGLSQHTGEARSQCALGSCSQVEHPKRERLWQVLTRDCRRCPIASSRVTTSMAYPVHPHIVKKATIGGKSILCQGGTYGGLP